MANENIPEQESDVPERWTAKRKVAVIKEVILGKFISIYPINLHVIPPCRRAMMLPLNTADLIAKAYDTNRNAKLDELKLHPSAAKMVGKDKNGAITTKALADSLQFDKVMIRKQQIMAALPSQLFTDELKPLKERLEKAENEIGRAGSNLNVLTSVQDKLAKIR